MGRGVIVLDSSALVAAFFGEPGAERVIPLLQRAAIGTANLAEVLERLHRSGADPETSYLDVIDAGIEIVEVSHEHAIVAAQLRPPTKSLGLSLGDRLCLALALERTATVLTAEQIWSRVDIGLKIDVIRQHTKKH